MGPDDVIESYVREVARRLPHGQRDDVAFELRALLADDLRDRAARSGRPADGARAEEMLRAVGHPADTAARYTRPFTIIEPRDTWAFLWAALGGGLVLSFMGTGAGLAWIGLLVLAFGARSLVRRSRPEAFGWKPRPVRDPDAAHRAATAGLALLFAVLLALYAAPGAVVGTVSGGRVAAATLAYGDSFTGPPRWSWLLVILALAAGLHLLVAVQGRWRPALRWAQLLLVLHCGIQLGWHLNYGAVFLDPGMDRLLFPALGAVAAAFWIAAGRLFYREFTRVRPAMAPGDRLVTPTSG